MRDASTIPRPCARARAARWLAIAALAAAIACRERAQRSEAAPPPESTDFAMADLAAAARVDACLQRVLALSAEYKAALTVDQGPKLSEHTDLVAKRFDEALPALDRAWDRVHDPRDRTHAAPLVAAARRLPELLRNARTELLASPQPAHEASDALARADDQISTELVAYRTFRSGWRIVDSPEEPEPILAFLRARRDLEVEEAALGQALRAPPADPASAAAAPAPADRRERVDRLVATARAAAERVDEPRRKAAQRCVAAEADALRALLGLSDPAASEEARARDGLSYQIAKVGFLEGLADYVELTAKAARPRPQP